LESPPGDEQLGRNYAIEDIEGGQGKRVARASSDDTLKGLRNAITRHDVDS